MCFTFRSPLVFSNARGVLSQCNTRLRLLFFLIAIKFLITRAVIGCNSVLYRRTEHGLMTLSWLLYFCFEILKTSFFSRNPLEIESLAEVQFVIDSCTLRAVSLFLENPWGRTKKVSVWAWLTSKRHCHFHVTLNVTIARLFEFRGKERLFAVNVSCCLVSQSNYLNNSNTDCDWPIFAWLIREQSTADATFTPLENKEGPQ